MHHVGVDGHAQAPDTCPYPRPFPDDFSACPAYFPRRWPAYTSTGQPLQTVWTCWHLASGSEEGATGHYYARCALGDQQARAQWAESAGSEQLACYRRFRQALGTTEDELIEAAVPRQAAVGYPRWGDQARDLRPSSLDQLAAAMLAAAEPHAHLLEPSGIRVEDWVLVTRSVLDHLVANRGGPWTPTPAFLDSLSPMARKLVGALAMSVALPANRAAPDASEG
jgi:hypothetical protein